LGSFEFEPFVRQREVIA